MQSTTRNSILALSVALGSVFIVSVATAQHTCAHGSIPLAWPALGTVDPDQTPDWLGITTAVDGYQIILTSNIGNVDLYVYPGTAQGGGIVNACNQSVYCSSTQGAGSEDSCAIEAGTYGIEVRYVSSTGGIPVDYEVDLGVPEGASRV